MAHLDVHRRRAPGSGWLLDCQADALAHFNTRMVVPLMPSGRVPQTLPRLHPTFTIDGEVLVMATHLASAVPLRELGPRVMSLADQRDAIIGALDVLITGI
jgi:toxin CcdB